ncbi:MAG: (Fe-S)-binding protein [Hyphomicrobiales bacterium]
MEPVLLSPASASLFGIPAKIIFILIPLIGIGVFAYIMKHRIEPLRKAAPDNRFDRYPERAQAALKIWLAQWRHPRYLLAGVLHIVVFFGFLTLAARSSQLVILGFVDHFTLPGLGGAWGQLYNAVKDYVGAAVFICIIILAVRRLAFKPERYAVPERYGTGHTAEAILVLGLIGVLLVSESLFDASLAAAQAAKGQPSHVPAPLTLVWLFYDLLTGARTGVLQAIHLTAYTVHDLTFFFFLCFLPMGKHFHVITSLFNVFFMRLDYGNVKPVRYGVDEGRLDELKSFGVKRFEDFTWKHMIDFYSCADCGRCSDRCPANRVKRPLSPRFISIKARDRCFKLYPLWGRTPEESEPLVGGIYSEDEIWSCTTCGACEQECPLGIEYIDKMVDLRRGMVDDGVVPQSLQKPLSALEKRGNPWGKLEKKRSDWIGGVGDGCTVKLFEKGEAAETLYFVDSIMSYDDRMQKIAQATARILCRAGVDFGVLGKDERDSGHEVRRFGEEMLFQALKEQNTEAIRAAEVRRILTADPHAYNALKKDYSGLPPVQHISEVIVEAVHVGRLKLKAGENGSKTYVFHDPCYLGRHNALYATPRQAIDAIPGIRRVEMTGNCRDRSFCCGGGGLMLFYEPVEDMRMGVVRVNMARDAGADVIVTACPFCLVNIEDAIKVAGLEGRLEAIDLCELIDKHIDRVR